ncbi:MAG: GxxExxY protein [Desulfuromonadaceae bacterium]
MICFNSIVVELKALSTTTGEHHAQVLNYLKATGMKLRILVNFGCYPKATIERLKFVSASSPIGTLSRDSSTPRCD